MLALAAGVFLSGCGNLRKLSESDPKAGIYLPRHSAQKPAAPVVEERAPEIITFKKQDGTELTFTPVEVDSVSGEKLMSVAIEEVVISAGSRRNLVERNGKINVEFIVTVPSVLQARDWQLVLEPQLLKGTQATVPETLDPLVYRGDKFGKMQLREYDRYDQERSDLLRRLRRYVLTTDQRVGRNITYQPNPDDKFDHLNDYFAPRTRYDGVDVLPGGEIFTRVKGEYPLDGGRDREAYLRSLAQTPGRVETDVRIAGDEQVRQLAGQRLDWTGLKRPKVGNLLYETDESIIRSNVESPRYFVPAAPDADDPLNFDSRTDAAGKPAAQSSPVFTRLVRHPYFPNARLDTVVYRPDGKIDYYYREQVQADENTSKLFIYLAGGVENRGGRRYDLRKSDTLTYSVASMTTFLDERTRYMQRIVLRDAEANARFFFTFPSGKSSLVDTLPENRTQLRAVRELTRGLMTDPVYIIDSITLRATASPEGTWQINDRLARERAEALRRVLVSEFQVLYDSLKAESVKAFVTLDDQGRQVVVEKAGDETLPNLPHLLRTQSLAEDWDELRRLVLADTLIADKEQVLEMMSWEGNPDTREWRIRNRFPKAYDRMRRVLYPQMRAVDFRFNLHRRGMKQDTVYTTEVDSNYMHAVELLRKRRYEEALTILRPYEDRNTALAYMSLGYDAAAYRILQTVPDAGTTADIQYMLAILAARTGDEEKAVNYFLRAVELRENLKFRGNLDPEISRLIRRYGLFREEFH